VKLLFIPGSGSARGEWVYQSEYFTDSEVVVLPGHPEGKPYSSIDDYVEWLRGYTCRRNYQDIILVGHSMGSVITLLYGLKYHGKLKALVLIGSGARLKVLPAILKALEETVTDHVAWRKWLENEYSLIVPEVRQALVEEGMQIGPAVTLNDYLCCNKFDIMDKVHTIKLRTLVICGSEDEKTPVKYTKYLANKIDGATEVVIEGVGHWVHVEKPNEVNQAIERFLDSLK